ncbi:MAG TPA: DUF1501 domain-containing protein [Pirellulales bacterium]|nr:DUF1501 domain-containing protein [Pirellulales bacterium]
MLTIQGREHRFCDGISRRTFLRIGGLSLGGLSLPDLLRAEGTTSRRHKSVIMVFLPGGPSHLDLYDLKPQAPLEVRGEFRPTTGRVPGVHICEHLPRLAAAMDKLAILRTVVGGPDDHASHMCFTGWSRLGSQPAGNWPSFGSVVAKLQGPARPDVPPYCGLSARMLHAPYNDPGPGFLGMAHSAFLPDDNGRVDRLLEGVSLERLGDRRALRRGLDHWHRELDRDLSVATLDPFYQQSFELLASQRLASALDLSLEEPRVRDRYGRGTTELIAGFNAAPRLNEQLLVARRLIEAGVRCVTVAFGAWDWHEKNFVGLRGQLPYLDQAVAALVEDLHDRGLHQDVLVVVWGEMGRSPRINQLAGRDHWPAVSCALLAGASCAGQVIGTTNRFAEMPVDRPVHFLQVLATVYEHLGIDPSRIALNDALGRPVFPLDGNRPLRELL